MIAISVNNEWVIVDLNILNHILKEKYESEGYSVKQEQKIINGYRTDLVAENDGTLKVIEIKGIISLECEVLAPLNSGERADRQLISRNEILSANNYKVEYAFVVLSNQVKKIKINDKYEEFKKAIIKCVKNGMEIKTYRIDLQKNEISIKEDEKIELEM